MIEFTDYTNQLQVARWGWTIALFLWLVGLSGMGFFLNYWVRDKALVWLCSASAIVGTLLVVSHLTRILNLPIAGFSSLLDLTLNFSSWMLIGIGLLVCLCLGSFFWSLIFLGYLFKDKSIRDFFENNSFVYGGFALLGVLSTIYSGFLLTQAVGISFWNSSLIPLLWIMSGMASSIGCIELMMIAGIIAPEKVKWSRRASLWTEVAELFTIFAFLHVAVSSNLLGARVGAESLISGPNAFMFWIGVILFGSIIPLAFNLLSRKHIYLAVSAVLGIFGALLLRASVLFAGYYEPTVF